jgi:hypothetical protein
MLRCSSPELSGIALKPDSWKGYTIGDLILAHGGRTARRMDDEKLGDVGKAARDWPQLNFAIYHSGFRHLGGQPNEGLEEWEKTGRMSWLSDLAEIPGKYGVSNVYGDLGAIFAWTVILQPRLAAAMLPAARRGGRAGQAGDLR